MKTIQEKQYESFADTLEAAIDSQVEYACEHDDAGDAYSHMPREGGWAYGNGDDRLKEWLKNNDLPIPEDFDAFVDELLDWSNIEPGHVFSNVESSGKFLVDSYLVGEVENQYCIGDLARLLDTDIDTAKQFAIQAMEDNRFCLRENGDGGVLSYTNTDASWNFTIDKEWALDRLEDLNS